MCVRVLRTGTAVYYASCRLTSAETRYAAIEHEALAVVWGVDRFRSFITGMPLTVLTDHKPLLQVFRADYKLTLASPRVKRLVLKVQDLSLTVQYRPGKHNVIADALFPECQLGAAGTQLTSTKCVSTCHLMMVCPLLSAAEVLRRRLTTRCSALFGRHW